MDKKDAQLIVDTLETLNSETPWEWQAWNQSRGAMFDVTEDRHNKRIEPHDAKEGVWMATLNHTVGVISVHAEGVGSTPVKALKNARRKAGDGLLADYEPIRSVISGMFE